MARHSSSVGAITGRTRGTLAPVVATQRTYHRGEATGGTRARCLAIPPGQDQVTRTGIASPGQRIASPGQGIASPGQPTEPPGHPEVSWRVRAARLRVRVAVALSGRVCWTAGCGNGSLRIGAVLLSRCPASGG